MRPKKVPGIFRNKRYRVPFVLLMAGSAGAVAPTSTQTFAFTRGAFLARGMAARPVGMGEAFTAVADDASAI